MRDPARHPAPPPALLLLLVLAAFIAGAAGPAAQPTYILNGFRLSGAKGVNPDELVAKLKDKAGARITEADIVADATALGNELKARHIEGQLFTTMAKKHGRVWVLFDFQGADAARLVARPGTKHLASQNFVGAVKISSATLNAATGLNPGEVLSDERIDAAREAILRAYKNHVPPLGVAVAGKMRTARDGQVSLTWTISEPKS